MAGRGALDSRNGVFVISGTQGAGKTTVSALLSRRFERGVHVSGDALQKMIVSGGEWPVASQTDVNSDVEGEAARQLTLRLHNACVLARSFHEHGFTVVIDDIVGGRRFSELQNDLSGIDFMFVMLTPSLESVRQREQGRGSQLWREWEWLAEKLAATTPRVGLWLDSTGLTAEETVDEILRRAWDEALVGPETVGAKGNA